MAWVSIGVQCEGKAYTCNARAKNVLLGEGEAEQSDGNEW
jgi:hypothetical protein